MTRRHTGIARAGLIILLLIVAAATATTAANASCRPPPADFSSPAVLARTAPASLWQGWAYHHPITLAATPASALVDQPVSIRVSGLKSGEPVTLHADMQDYQGITWSAHATFTADKDGVVDVRHAAPRYGTYAGVHPMGLVWSMSPENTKHPDASLFIPSGDRETVTLTALADQRVLARSVFKSLSWNPAIRKTRLHSDGLVGVLFTPAQPGLHPAVIVLGGSEGGLEPQVAEAALLASHGYTVLGLAYFQGFGNTDPRLASLPQELVNIPLEYFARAADWLKRQPGVEAKPIAILGWSKGAEAALLVAATYPQDFRAVVAYAPSAVVNSGLNYGQGPITSSWSLNGKPLPFVPFGYEPGMFAGGTPIVLRPGYVNSLKDAKAVGPATIPVERIAGPVLLISGSDDQIWPSATYAHRIMARLKAHHHAYADQSLCYHGAGHFIIWPYRPALTTGAAFGNGTTILFGGGMRAYAFADRDSWRKVLMFLQKALH
ncbi:MAG: acyl-CoA thioester hydrolase/BAAT C-terminal domain-containing protein [Gammaproteobacteria bacterium]